MAVKGTMTKTVSKKGDYINVKFAMTADAGGDCDDNGVSSADFIYTNAYGIIKQITVTPGSTPASSSWSLAVNIDSTSIDALVGTAGSLSGNGELVRMGNQGSGVWNKTLKPVGANMGNGGQATLEILIERKSNMYV